MAIALPPQMGRSRSSFADSVDMREVPTASGSAHQIRSTTLIGLEIE
jgi:hypothetical protein